MGKIDVLVVSICTTSKQRLAVANLFFRLRNGPDDEAAEVRQLLDDHSIPWFETSAGRWGISFPAIWLSDERDQVRARELLDTYQQARMLALRAQQAERRQRGCLLYTSPSPRDS